MMLNKLVNNIRLKEKMMEKGLLLIERFIIEGLSKKDMNIQELAIQTRFDHGLLLNILPNLMMRNMINYKNGIYSLNRLDGHKWIQQINKKEFLKDEVKDVFQSLVNNYFKEEVAKNSDLKVQKIWLTKDEELILNSHLKGLESFFKNVKEARLKKTENERLFEQKVVVWGHMTYGDIVNEILEAV